MSEELWTRQMEWAITSTSDHALHDSQFRANALDQARCMMQIARRNVETIVDRLQDSGYEFVTPEMAHQPPQADVAKNVQLLASRGIYVPVALQAWLEVVGCVSLIGSHPSWPNTGCLGVGQQEGIWLADPLVVFFDAQSVLQEFAAWNRQQDSEETPGGSGAPFCIPFAPDDTQKAGLSGGCPYQLATDRDSIDPFVLHERRRCSFVAHLRHAFAWGGFPGFEFIREPPWDFINRMKADLELL